MNRIVKKSLMVFAIVGLFLSNMMSVRAIPQQISLGDAPKTGMYIAGVSFHYKKTTDGKYLYCIDMAKDTAKNVKANLIKNSPAVNGGIYHILRNGYPEKTITGDQDKDYYITQTAVWWYLDETTGSHNLGDQFKNSGEDKYGLRSKVKALVNAGLQHRNDGLPEQATTVLELTTPSKTMALSNGYYVSSDIKATKLVNTDKYTVTLTNAPSGVVISKNGSDFNYSGAFTLSSSDSFKVKIPSTSVTDTSMNLKIEAKATGASIYTLAAYKPEVSSMQSVVLLDKEQTNANASLTLDLVSSKVSVLKVDTNTKQPLAGAVLVLKDSNGKEITRWTSTVNAHVIRNLSNGSYTVEEESAPNGYKLNKNKASFTITNDKRDIRIDFENAPEKIVVSISKVDASTKDQIAGAVIVIKDAKGTVVYKFESKTTAEVITDLEYGTYTVEELSAPEGYIKSNNVATFTIDKDHLSHQIVVENTKETIVPDTANASSMILFMIGIVITGFGISYVRKNGQKKFSK